MKRIFLAVSTALAIALTLATAKAEPFKVGFVYVGPIGDHGWTYRHNEGRKAVEKAFGNKVKTTYVESVKEGADAERVIRQMAAAGHGIIFTTSFGYMNPTIKVAKQFPKVKFEHATGYKRSKNVSTYSARFYEGRAVAGVVAGHMTKSNVIGYIASFPIPEVVRGINSFTLALRRVNPKATVKVVWVSSWYDPGKEAEAAKVLMDQGADVILQHTDSTAPLQAAQDAGKWGVGQASDMMHFAPKAHLTAIVNNWDGYYVSRVKAAMDGSWKSKDTWDGLAAGMVKMAAFNGAIPEKARKAAQATVDAIKAGKLHPFQGPFNKQDGSVGAKAGQTLDDGTLLGMNWYVEGIEGKLPN